MFPEKIGTFRWSGEKLYWFCRTEVAKSAKILYKITKNEIIISWLEIIQLTWNLDRSKISMREMIPNKKIRHMTSLRAVTSSWRHQKLANQKLLTSAHFWHQTSLKCTLFKRASQNIKNEGSIIIRGLFVQKLWQDPILTDFDDVIKIWRHCDVTVTSGGKNFVSS